MKSLRTIAMSVIVTLATTVAASSSNAAMRIGFVQDGRWQEIDQFHGSIKSEILELTAGEFQVSFPPTKRLDGEWSVAQVRSAVDKILADPDVDLVISLGLISSYELARRENLPKPVIAPFIVDRELQDMPYREGASGVRNLAYVDQNTTVREEIEAFREVYPCEHLAMIMSDLVLEVLPKASEELLREASELGIEFSLVVAKGSAEEVLAKLPADADAVFISPLMGFSEQEFDRLVAGINERRLPSFSYYGRDDVERGVMVGLSEQSDSTRIARRVALNVQRILLGEDAGTIGVAFPQKRKLTLNMATAEAIGFSPSWSVLAEADLVHDQRTSVARRLTLARTIEEAGAANLDLRVKEREVAAGRENIRSARSRLLPQAETSLTSSMIDDDRAATPFSTRAERVTSGGLSISQLVFSEAALADLTVQRHLHAVREAELDELNLDIALDASQVYLNLLSTKALERIEKDNLDLTRANLDLAKTREAIGTSGQAEVYRWESEVASDRKAVVEAIARRIQAEIALNRLLNRPLEEQFETTEVGFGDARLAGGPRRLLDYVDNPRDYGVFIRFLVADGLEHAPELNQLGKAIAAQERALKSAQRSFWSPTLALQGDLFHQLSEGGSQGDPAALFGGMNGGGAGADLAAPDDTDWSVGLNLSLPISTGGGRLADRARAREELSRLRVQRKSVAEKIDQRIRSAMHEGNASYQGIALARDSAEAAGKNLRLVTDAYSRGVVSIIDLLDAQNAALVADQAAANASYDFLLDLAEVERAASLSDRLGTNAELTGWFERLDVFFEEAGITLRR